MGRPARLRTATVAAVLTILAGSACQRATADHQLLDRFFAASRLRDRTALARYATVIFEPGQDGVIERFEIVSETALGDTARELSVRARVRRADQPTTDRTLTITLQKAQAAQLASASSTWVITAIR